MTIYAIIILVFLALNLLAGAYMHGKPRQGKHNFLLTLVVTLINFALLYFGGFFNF